MRPVQALFFDLDDTLRGGSGSHEAVVRTCRHIAAARPGLDAARLLEANSEVWQRYWPEVEERWTLGVLSGNDVGLEAWRRALRACGSDEESLAQLARETHMQHAREALRLFDDVRGLIDRLKKARLPLALITNGASDTQRETLRVLKIEQEFAAVVISGEVGVAKPDPSIFGLAVDALGIGRENVWHVGDSLRTDVGGARAAGLTAVWLNRDGVRRTTRDPQPEYEIRSLWELAPLISAEV